MYIPLSKCTINLKTTGGYLLDGEPYTGDYFIINTPGKPAFTGKSPLDDNPRPLYPNNLNPPSPDTETPADIAFSTLNPAKQSITDTLELSLGDNKYPLKDYYKNNNVESRILPTPYTIRLTKDQKTQKQIARYFVKKNKSFKYFEINEEQYNQLESRENFMAWDLFDQVRIFWTINGDSFNVTKQNKKTVLDVESPKGKNWALFSQIFTNKYLQFYQGIQENLSTSGGVYKTSDGKEYIGPYHIHPEKGPMVGAKHISTPHDYLYKIGSDIQQNITGSNISQNDISIPQPSQTYTPPPSIGGGSSGGGGY